MDIKGGSHLNPIALLEDDGTGNRSNFLEQLRQQHIAEALSYDRHVLDCIDQFKVITILVL